MIPSEKAAPVEEEEEAEAEPEIEDDWDLVGDLEVQMAEGPRGGTRGLRQGGSPSAGDQFGGSFMRGWEEKRGGERFAEEGLRGRFQ